MISLIALSMAKADRLIIDFQDGLSLDQAETIAQAPLNWIHPNSADEALAVLDTENVEPMIDRLAPHPQVEAIEPSITYQALSEPNDPLYPQQWNMTLIGAQQGWAHSGGTDIIVAVIDTGVAPVEDLESSRILEGMSFVEGEPNWHDKNGHGTHVAGTIAQTTNNNYGAAGVAPNAMILPIKALGQYGAGQSEWIASSIDEAVDRGADIINLSLGGQPSKVIEVAVQKANTAGVLIVAAAGNTGKEGVHSPASLPGVLAVSATGPQDDLAPYSTYGEHISLCAPGGDKSQDNGGIVQETVRNGEAEFLAFQGTSMAAPHVSGAAAILLAAGAETSEQVKTLLQENATDLGEHGWDKKYGYGRLDVAASLNGLHYQTHATRAAVALLLALAVGAMAQQSIVNRIILSVSSLSASGGLFWIPALSLFSKPLLSHFSSPIWQSALLWTVLSIALLPFKRLRWVGIGCCIGVFSHLGGGWFDQQLTAPMWSHIWFPLNMLLLCLPIALSVIVGRYMKGE